MSFPAEASTFVFATFKGDTAAGEQLSIYQSSDALNFTLVSDTGFAGPSNALRDPSILKFTDGKFYVAYTDPLTASCCGPESHFSIATSADLVHWTNLTTVSAGVTGASHTWAPEWFVDDGIVKIIVNIDTLNTDSDFRQYIYTAKDSALSTWSGPVPMGTGPNYIDASVIKVGATYHAFLKNETTRYVEQATATSLTGPWTFIGTGNWAGWGSGMEGPILLQLDDGAWRIYLDGQGSTPFLYSDSVDLKTWSAPQPLPGIGNLVRHGTVIRDVPCLCALGTDAGPPNGVRDAGVDAQGTIDAGGSAGRDARASGDSGQGADTASAQVGEGDAASSTGSAEGGPGVAADSSVSPHPEPLTPMDASAPANANETPDTARSSPSDNRGGCSCDALGPRGRPWGGFGALALLALVAIRRRSRD